MAKGRKVTHRILYDDWINSQLSIARHYGGMTYNGKKYIFDPEQTKKPTKNGKYKPDLITYE